MHPGQVLCDEVLDLGRGEVVFADVDGHVPAARRPRRDR